MVIGKGEKIGAALARALKATTGVTTAGLGGRMFRTNIRDVPAIADPLADPNGPTTQVQYLIDGASAGAGHVIGWSVLKPGSTHRRHRQQNCDEFFIVLKGQGEMTGEIGPEPCREGDVVYLPRGVWHGLTNTSNQDLVIIWGWMGAGSVDAAGFETAPTAG